MFTPIREPKRPAYSSGGTALTLYPPTTSSNEMPRTPMPRFYPKTRPMHLTSEGRDLGIIGLSPAGIAALKGDTEGLRQLHMSGVDLSSSAYNDWSPAALAALNGRIDCLKILEKAGVDFNVATRIGTPMMIAQAHNKAEVIAYLNGLLLTNPVIRQKAQKVIFSNSIRSLVENNSEKFLQQIIAPTNLE